MTIVSHVLEIFRQGVWASLTGGWCYDPRHTFSCNVVHMYLWMLLFILPLLTSLCFEITWLVAALYAAVVGSVFLVIKSLNFYLHNIFDTQEPIDAATTDEQAIETEEENLGEFQTQLRSGMYENFFENCHVSTNDVGASGDDFNDQQHEYIELKPLPRSQAVKSNFSGQGNVPSEEEEDGEFDRLQSFFDDDNALPASSSVKRDRCEVVRSCSSQDFLPVEADVHVQAKDDGSLRTAKSDSKFLFRNDQRTCGHKTESVQRRGASTSDSSSTAVAEANGIARNGDHRLPAPSGLFLSVNEVLDETDRDSPTSLARFDYKYSDCSSCNKITETTEDCSEFDKVDDGTDTFCQLNKHLDSKSKNIAGHRVDDSRDSKYQFSNSGGAVRRTRSTVETCPDRRKDDVASGSTSSTLLSEARLQECRGRGVRKSYPGKTSSTDIFLLQHADRKQSSSDVFCPTMSHSGSVGSYGFETLPHDDSRTAYEGGDNRTSGELLKTERPIKVFISRPDSPDEATFGNTSGRDDVFSVSDVALGDIPEKEPDVERACEADESRNLRELLDNCSPATAVSVSPATETVLQLENDGDIRESSDVFSTGCEESPTFSLARRDSSPSRLSPTSPRRKLIQSLRETLETLKSETPKKQTGGRILAGNDLVSEFQVLRDVSTPDLRWLFEEATLNSAVRGRDFTSSSPPSPTAVPRLSTSYDAVPSDAESAVATSYLNDVAAGCIPEAGIVQQQVREHLVEEIKRLLEEIIDSHPEALEAIESVRQAKLASIRRPSSTNPGPEFDSRRCAQSVQADIEDNINAKTTEINTGGRSSLIQSNLAVSSDRRQSIDVTPRNVNDVECEYEKPDVAPHRLQRYAATRHARIGNRRRSGNENVQMSGALSNNLALLNLAGKRNLHVATSHDDTSEGAVHTFKDNDGNWFAYAFNDDIPAAQLWGSDQALMELIASQQESHESGNRGEARGHFRGVENRSPPTQRSGAAMGRTPSCSSIESFLALDAPTSVLHVGGANTVVAGPSSNNADGGRSSLGEVVPTSSICTDVRDVMTLRRHRHLSRISNNASTVASNGRRRSRARPFVPLRSMLNRTPNSRLQNVGSAVPIRPSLDLPIFNLSRSGAASGAAAAASGGGFVHNDGVTTPGDYSTITLSSSHFLELSGSLRTPSDMSHSSFRTRFLATLAGGVDGLPAIGAPTSTACNGQSSALSKRKLYYRVSLCPSLVGCCPAWLANVFDMVCWPGTAYTTDVCCPQRTFKLRLDRLRLIAMFDRNRTPWSAVIDVLLAATVAFVAACLLSRPLYYDLSVVAACMVTAGAQFSLLKSVQPDAASPVHGYNWLVAYSRPVYFCLLGVLVYVLDSFYASHPNNPFATETLYSNFPSATQLFFNRAKDFFAMCFLFTPLIFMFGLLPQLNTFVIYVLEQVDMLIFGGTASVGLFSSIFSVSRSVICAAMLFAVDQFALQQYSSNIQKNAVFSIFCGFAVAVSYLLSRSSSDPRLLWNLLTETGAGQQDGGHQQTDDTESGTAEVGLANKQAQAGDRRPPAGNDPLPQQLRQTMILRLKHDCIAACFLGVFYFALHFSTVFSVFKSGLIYGLSSLTVAVGLLCHYILPHLRQHTPWGVIASPLLKTHEHRLFDCDKMAKLVPFERLYAILNFIERNLLYPAIVLCLLTAYVEDTLSRFGIYWSAIIMSVASMKLLRAGYCNPSQLYIPLGGATLAHLVDFPSISLNIFLNFYVLSLLYPKFTELMLKLQFMVSYVAPWQISWGSAFHAFAQPTAIPHSAFTLAISLVSSLFSAPLNPFLGSAVFLMSYVRPVKFWEKDYNTKRVDHSNTRLISQLDRGPMTDQSNLNAIFYEHLTRSLQKTLAGDLALGRLAATVSAGDCFILASFYLNCLVHLVEIGNGFVTFQLRGLEFRGTYCQQREVEAISEEIGDQGCCCSGDSSAASCCCIRGFLSLNSVWNLRWLAWQVTASKFVLEGYSVTDNSAMNLLQMVELRNLLITLYVKCTLYYAVRSPKLEQWLSDETIIRALERVTSDDAYVDVDPTFCEVYDDDYDHWKKGITRSSFCDQYLRWISHCVDRRIRAAGQPPLTAQQQQKFTCEANSPLTALCFGLSLMGRRILGAAAQGRHTTGAESFLYGLHALLKGDFRITCARDEWVFADMDLLQGVVAPAVRMALKLLQDHFTAPDDFLSADYIYDSISHYDRTLFISHENDPAWRQAVLANTQSLLALRHVFEDGQDDFKIIMLNRRHMNFRVIVLNRECVRAFWAGQQQELIFLRNRNPERGSIQNSRQVLRNMINSSADQPIGYPIYVSPLTTSFCETHPQVAQCVGPPFSFELIRNWCGRIHQAIRGRFGTSGCSNMASLAMQQSANCENPIGTAPSDGAVSIEMSALNAASSTLHPRSSVVSTSEVRAALKDSSNRPVRLTSSTLPTLGSNQSHPTTRHWSAPAVLQRSAPHSSTSGDGNSTETLIHAPSDKLNRSRPIIRNSVVATDAASASTKLPQVSVGSLSAVNVADESSSAQSRGGRRGERVRIMDVTYVLETLDKFLPKTNRTPVIWPNDQWRRRGGRLCWKTWRPFNGLVGSIVHMWTSWHPDAGRRSHLDKTILLLNVLDGRYFVPVLEQGVEWIGDEL